MKLFGLKTCDTCRKAIKSLNNKGLDYVDVRRDGVPDDVLDSAFAQFGLALVNKSSTTWRGFSDDEKARDPLELLREHPTLMKRPLIVNDGVMTLGWKKEVEDQYT
ncbi:MAG: ArsC/Spx/MgsR family protein [Planktomarina sp.]